MSTSTGSSSVERYIAATLLGTVAKHTNPDAFVRYVDQFSGRVAAQT